ncbi:MAG: TatD family deoxyribonuclease [Ruminococcaceae bacterium]|nr:TatD family deoxyribonuclease [Oscillospiraceae bacterium]
MIFDTHAHYDAHQFNPDRHEVLAALPEKGVQLVVNPGCDEASSRMSIELAARYDYIYAAVGWHPEEWEKWDEQSIHTLRELCAAPKVVAIGEIGLDYYWDKEHKELQKEMLTAQLKLARELDLPVIIHDREAHEDCLDMVSCFPGLRGVFHCYSGSAEMAKILVKDGWYLGFDGPITYKNNKKAAEVLSVVPMERILLETDSPYMAPVPHRGKRCDSSMLPHMAEKVAEVKGLTAEEVLRLTNANGRRLFGLEKA